MSIWLPLIVCLVGGGYLAWKRAWSTLATVMFAVGLFVLLEALSQAHVGLYLR